MPTLYNPKPFILKHKETGKVYNITENCEFIGYMADKFEVVGEKQNDLVNLFNYNFYKKV